jgi:hypothetical protein
LTAEKAAYASGLKRKERSEEEEEEERASYSCEGRWQPEE